MLLAVFPFIAAAVLYWITMADLFGPVDSQIPSNWSFRIGLPVLTGSLTALAAAAAQEKVSGLLLSAAGLGVMFTIVTAAVLRSERQYFELKLNVGLGSRRLAFPRWHAMRLVGLAIIGYACAATLVVAAG